MKDINYIESLNVSAPGLIDPGIIILGKSNQVQGPEYSYREFEESPYIQYKASTNKFLGYIGDLAEYKFKHIPEKWHYNNISTLELLNSIDQTYIGTKLPTLDAISKHAVFTELVKDNFKEPSSLPNSNYDKFKPRYFGTAVLENKTVMLFMVPPGYNTIFISNGSGIYSEEEALSIYGPQKLFQVLTDNLYDNIPYIYYPHSGSTDVNVPVRLSWVCLNAEENVVFDVYVCEESQEWGRPNFIDVHSNSVTVSGLSSNTTYKWKVVVKKEENEIYTGETLTFTTKRLSFGGSGQYSSPSDSLSDLNIRPMNIDDYNQIEFVVETIGSQTSSEEDSNSQPTTTRGRGKDRNNPTTVSTLDEDYSLVINNETGMSVVVSNSDLYSEYAENTGADITLYAYEFPNSSYTFKKLWEYDFHVKMKTSYSWYQRFTIDETNPEASLKTFLEGTVGNPPRVRKVFDTIVKQELGTHVEGGNTYTTYLAYVYINLDSSQTNLYGISKYTEIKETDTYKIFKKVSEYKKEENEEAKDIRGYQIIKFDWNETLYSQQSGNGSGCCTILTDEGILTKGPDPDEDDCWFVKDYKEDSLPHTHELDEDRVQNIDVEEKFLDFPIIRDWDRMYGLANYYEYVRKASQLEIQLEDEYADYYKLVKLVISPNEGQVLSFKEINSSSSNTSIEIGDVIEVGSKYYLLSENLTLMEITATESNYSLSIGDEVVMGNKYYILQYLPSISNIEALNIVNLGYKTSENPLKNLDKYLVRETEFIKKYSTLNSNIVDLTSGSYLSTGIRDEESDTQLGFIKYSYRKKYRKGQTVLMGLPEDLKSDIIDINRIVPSMWSEESGNISIPDSILGDIIYDYNSGLICRVTEEDDDYIIDSEPYTENYLYRYRNEYYLYEPRELVRVGKLGIRTWASLCDDNQGNLPGMSRSWMSRDGDLSKEDKVWVMIFSKEGRKKVLGTVTRKRVEGIDIEGICLRLMTGYLGKTVMLNGVQVSVETMELGHEGIVRDFQDLYLIRQVNRIIGDVVVEERAVADLTNNLIFKDKINYVVV